MSNRLKIIIFILLSFLLYFFLFSLVSNYNFFNSYDKIQRDSRILPTYRQLDSFANNLDLSKTIIPRGGFQDENAGNLSLSYNDLTVFRDYYFNSISYGFLSDHNNEWRKAKIILPDIGKVKIKVKIHGTSATPIRQSVSYFDDLYLRVKNKVFKTLGSTRRDSYEIDDLDISQRGYAFKVKLRDDIVYKGKERLNFLAPYDDWTTSTNSLNKYISSLGIITTYGDYMNLFVNGTDIGLYLAVENIDKSLLERDFQITNYAVLKNNDDWTKAWKSHYSPTMQTSFDIEQKGELETQEIALFQIKRLFEAIENSDFTKIKKLVDVKYLAKVYALALLTGDFHPLGGDNLKYVYDFSKGTFKVAYRVEGRPLKIKFSNNKLQNQYGQNLLLEKLATQGWFREIAYGFLKQISDDEDYILEMLFDEYSLYNKAASKSRHSSKDYYFFYLRDLEAIKSNLSIIKKVTVDDLAYRQANELEKLSKILIPPDYSKVFITLEKKGNNNYLNVLNDSISNLALSSVLSCKGDRYTFEDKKIIPPSSYNKVNGLIKNLHDIRYEIPFSCIETVEIYKEDSKTKLGTENIYINYSRPFEIIESGGLDQFGPSLKKILSPNNDIEKYIVSAGYYTIEDNITFPDYVDVVFEPGTKIFLSEGISIYIKGGFIAEGTKDQPIILKNLNSKPFGSIAIKGTSLRPAKVKLNNLHLSGGSESIIDGTYFSSQMSIHIADVTIKNSSFKYSFSDDGLNIKNSQVDIQNNLFENNSADQVDLDFVYGSVSNNVFDFIGDHEGKLTDGLDISGSVLNISNNLIQNMSDKGLSIGEKSQANIFDNYIEKNNIGIALKDGSKICLKHNSLVENSDELLIYIKKSMYQMPSLFIDDQNMDLKNMMWQNCNVNNFIKI